jgi:hypothetical protein
MELSRRDALVALTSAGIGVGGVATLSADRDLPVVADDGPDAEVILSTLTAVAGVVYPSDVSNVDAFVESYAAERLRRGPAYREGTQATVSDLDDYVAVHTDSERYAELDTATAEAILHRLGVDSAAPEREGAISGRVRYYLVNDLLFALYASPTGGELVGIENPQGYPGGRTHSRRPK